MDTFEDELPSPMNKSVIDQVDDSNANPVHEFEPNHDFPDHNFFPVNSNPSDNSTSLPGVSTEVNFPECSEASNAILKYISEMLMEEEEYLVNKPCMLQECLALQAAEKSLHDVLVQDQNPSSSDPLQDVFESSGAQFPNPLVLSSEGEITHLKHNSSSVVEPRELQVQGKDVSSNSDKDGSDSSNGSRSKKTRQREDKDSLDDWRRNKDPAVYADEFELPRLFDEVLLCQGEKQESNTCSPKESEKLQLNRKSKGSKGKKTRKKKLDDHDAGMVDLWTLLSQCAQAVASYDKRNANEQLKQIRLNSSPYGDGTQRLAHYVANGLELRLGADVPSYASLPSSEMSAADILKAYQTYITACPFHKMSNFYANQTILKLAEKATRLHIIDFGVLYGYQWPCLIQDLSKRQGGPPMLRITGVEFPQPGFRPSERVEQTGWRLVNYCKRFNVPFEYNVIATNWETIRPEDIKIDRDELTVVNCLYRLKNLRDDTVTDCPRDTVLKLIRRISPDLFIHGIVNGSYNAPFFDIRFREALLHFSSLFDMFEATVPREDPQRLLYEQEVFGREVINVIACEGPRRVERPETYKQWQIRYKRAGFRQVPSDQEILKEVRSMVKRDYHKDFSVDEDGMWVLQGWKGRICHAISYWKPV